MAQASEIVEQGGGIAFRFSQGILTVLLVTSRRDPRDWIFPKGHIEPGESADETALRETQKEAGVDGTVRLSDAASGARAGRLKRVRPHNDV